MRFITTGILFQLTVLFPQYTLNIHNKSQETQVSLHVPHFLSDEKSGHLMVLKCFFKQNATTCPSCSSPSVWNEGILDQFASVSSASPFRVRPQSPLKVSRCTDPIARTNPTLEGGPHPQSRNPCRLLLFCQHLCRCQALQQSIIHHLEKVPSQW